MVVLGLGSNIGDRLSNLRKALHRLTDHPDIVVRQVSPVYISDALLPENAPADWDIPYLNLAIRCDTKLEPLALLKELKTIEWSIGRKPEVRHWGPRILDIDILAWDAMVMQTDILTVPHENLPNRPFAFWPLADVAPLWQFPLPGANQGKTAAQIVEQWGSRFSGAAPFHTKQIYQRIDTPQLVGILNVTPDSFSDGGRFFKTETAIQQMLAMIDAGAEIIDIGAESTSPHAEAINAEIEWQRLQPILEAIPDAKRAALLPAKISLDTRHVQIAKQALAYEIDWINDVTGLDDLAMRELMADVKQDCVIMHHKRIPERRHDVIERHQDPVSTVLAWGEARLNELEKQGIARERIIFDPGIGFGKMAEQSLIVLQGVAAFKQLGVRVMIGHSRKTFLAMLTDLPFAERDIETAAMTVLLSKQPIDYLRVHNVAMNARGLRAARALNL